MKRRQDAVVLNDAVKATGKPAEACRDLIRRCMDSLRQIEKHAKQQPSPAEMKEILRDRVKILRKARGELKAMGSPLDFLEAFDGQLIVAERMAKFFKVPPGSRPADITAKCAAIMARDILRQLDVPAKKTAKGSWYQLSSLLYEFATDKHDVDLSKYCREADKPLLRYSAAVPLLNQKR